MRIKTLLFAVLVAAVAAAGTAEARKLSNQDKALARKLTAHLGAMGDIMDKHGKSVDKTLDKLEAYVKKNRGAIHTLAHKLDKVSKELDAEEQKKLEAFVKDDPDMKRFVSAAMAFGMSLGQNQAAAERFGNIMKSLAPDETTESKKKPAKKKPAKQKPGK